MKIARARIENFRMIPELELDFTDSLGRVRDVSLIVGPNTSGKTTILDALAVSIGLGTELSFGRPDFVISPRTIVRRGALECRVTCWVRFSREEIEATREIIQQAEENLTIPDNEEVQVAWVYPDPNKRSRFGFTYYDPSWSWPLFKARTKVASLLSSRRVDWSWFQRVGGVFTFDQQRTGMGRTIPREIWNIISGAVGNGEPDDSNRRTADPRAILLSLAVQSKFEPAPGVIQTDQFKLIKERYDQLCSPHKLLGVVRDDLGELDLRFTDGIHEYYYDGLSSGEKMLLLFLIRMVSEHVHQSVVLVDEVELHQHPIWQSRLLHALPKIGINNQIIATTHSPYLRDLVPREAIINLGEIVEVGEEAKR
jgi:predicted ATPase